MYLLSDFPQNNSFPHKDFKTYKEELEFWKIWLENKGYKTFVKDNSFLNFPAFTIYIPQISDVQIDSDRRKISWTIKQVNLHILSRDII